MDAQVVDMEVLSINPFWYGKDRDLAAQIVKIQNEKLAELCASKPDRFAAFASLTLQAPDLAVQELETAVKKQGLRGAAIGGRVAGDEFSNPKFHPVWAKAEELGAVLFIHPGGVPELSKRLSGNGWLGNTIGNPLETTIALSHLIFEGTLDRFPGLKIISRARRRLFTVLRRPVGSCLFRRPGRVQSQYHPEEEADRVSQAALFRLPGIYAGGDPPSCRPGRRQSDRHGQRLSLSMAAAPGRSHLRLHLADGGGEAGDPRRHRHASSADHNVTSRPHFAGAPYPVATCLEARSADITGGPIVPQSADRNKVSSCQDPQGGAFYCLVQA